MTIEHMQAENVQLKLIDCIWRGWLFKKGHGISGRWEQRWFELRQEPARKSKIKVFLKYYGRGTEGPNPSLTEKRLTVEDARREERLDSLGRACISVIVSERRKPVLLSAATAKDADGLLSDILSMLGAQAELSGKTK